MTFNLVNLFFVLILLHLVADFVLQGNLAVKKRGFNKYMAIHSGIASLLFFIPLSIYPAGKTLIATIILFFGHGIIDAIKVEISKVINVDSTKYLYWLMVGIDQMLHVFLIYLLFKFVVEAFV